MRHKAQGLTLVELMVTLAVAIILLAVGMPLYTGVVANNRAVAEANGFLSSFKLARSEAVKRGSFVVVAPTSVSAGWESGWQVFEEPDDVPGDGNFGAQQDAAAEPTLRTWDAIDVTLNGEPGFVAFDSTGEATAASTITVTPLDPTVTRSRCLQVAASGQIRMRSFRPDAPFNETCP